MGNKLMEDKRILTLEQRNRLIIEDIAFNPDEELDGTWSIIIPDDWSIDSEWIGSIGWIFSLPKAN